MDFYNTEFYDKASSEYSERRYNRVSESYIQFFFKRRLNLVLNYIKNNLSKDNRSNMRLLESGCADGIVIDSIIKSFPNLFSEYVGTDISKGMIDVANNKNIHNNVLFCLKNTQESGYFDLVLAIGFISPGIFDDEFNYINKYLKKNGIFIISLASKKSLYTLLKLKDKEYVKDYWTHNEYKNYLEKRFEIIDSMPCGFFIPKLWSIPFIARILQPILENIMKYITPDLFHEKLYILRKKG